MGDPLQIVFAIALGAVAVVVMGLAIEGCFLRKLNIIDYREVFTGFGRV
jgi:hypothetical protein